MTCPVQLDLRPMVDDDRGLVIDSWRRSFYKSRDGATYPQLEQFYADYTPVVVDLVGRSRVYIACLKAESSAIVGWAALEDGVLHYVFVKRRWRQLGVAKWLLTRLGLLEAPTTYTHRTRMCEPSWFRGVYSPAEVRVPDAWQYRKFKAYRPKEAA